MNQIHLKLAILTFGRVGPRKLAKSLDAAFSLWTEAAEAEISESGSEITTPLSQPSMISFSVDSFLGASAPSNYGDNERDPASESALHFMIFPKEPKRQEVALLVTKQEDLVQSVHKTNDSETAIRESRDYERAAPSLRTVREQEILLVDDNTINLRVSQPSAQSTHTALTLRPTDFSVIHEETEKTLQNRHERA